MSVIYRITNMANGKYYIGSTQSLARREWQHKYELRKGQHKNPKLQAAWNKYGEEMFVFEVIENVPEGECARMYENKYLHECVGLPDCYNINTDATAMRLGITLSEESKLKISVNRKGKYAGEEHYRFGKTLSPEVKLKIGETQRGVPKPERTEEHRRNLSKAVSGNQNWLGKTHTQESIAKMARAVIAVKPDGLEERFIGMNKMRKHYGVGLVTVIRACGTGKPVKTGVLAGWTIHYADEYDRSKLIEIPEEYKSLPRTRQVAIDAGTKYYFTGLPCTRGHVDRRYVKGACTACVKEDYAKDPRRRTQPHA